MRISDWSSDVCSSDLPCCDEPSPRTRPRRVPLPIERLRKDSEPDGGGRGQRADENENRPELVGLELITRAGVEHEVTQAREEMLEKSPARSEEHTSELQSLMRISYAVFCLKKKKKSNTTTTVTKPLTETQNTPETNIHKIHV